MPQKIFTMPLAASNTYGITEASNAIGIIVSNDSASTGNITITGTAKTYISGVVESSAPITVRPGSSRTIAFDSPGLECSIDTEAGATGALILIL